MSISREEAEKVVAGLSAAVAKIDAADAACPIRSGRKSPDKCPKCRATSSEPCGPVVSAEYQLVQLVRNLLSERDQ